MDDDYDNSPSFLDSVLGPAASGIMSRCLRSIERGCCAFFTYVPLGFVYGLTLWATWSVVSISSHPGANTWLGKWSSILIIFLFVMLNISYTVAVFTPPGSTTSYPGSSGSSGYSALPTHMPANTASNLTVKANGEMRFCKKCQARKPDRAHHCSTCRRCILKMDHHCPWLATCVGLHNHKAFLLFLIYTTLLCAFSFVVSAVWVWSEVFQAQVVDNSFAPVNHLLLALLAGILGICVGAFTGWHISLASRGQTTIECLEKTRYLAPLRKTLYNQHIAGRGIPEPSYGQQLVDIHANSLPGITRPEEGAERSSSASPVPSTAAGTGRTYQSYEEMERHRSRKRHDEYQDQEDARKLPHAFDLGWRLNLVHLFGPSPWLWALPVCNTTGDGWTWQTNQAWADAHSQLRVERTEQYEREVQAGWGAVSPESPEFAQTPTPIQTFEYTRPMPSPNRMLSPHPATGNIRSGNSSPFPPRSPRSPSKADRVLGRDPGFYVDNNQLRTLTTHGSRVNDDLDDISD